MDFGAFEPILRNSMRSANSWTSSFWYMSFFWRRLSRFTRRILRSGGVSTVLSAHLIYQSLRCSASCRMVWRSRGWWTTRPIISKRSTCLLGYSIYRFTSSDAVFSEKAKREAKKMLDMEDTVSVWESNTRRWPKRDGKNSEQNAQVRIHYRGVAVQKYFFWKHFIDTTPDTMLSLAWTHVDFPRLVSKMIKDKTHIVHRLFDEMGVEFGGEFPDQPMTGLDMKLVNK